MVISKKKASFFIICSIVTFLCLRMESIRYLTPFGNLYLEIPFVLSGILILVEIIKHKSLSNVMWISLAYFVIVILSTFMNEGKIHMTLMNICPALGMCLFSDYSMRTRPHEFAKNVGYFLMILIVLDMFSILLYPNGMYSNALYSANWILGFKTQRANIAVPAIALLATESYLEYSKIRLYVWFVAVASIIASYLCESTGGMLGVIFEMLFLVLLIYTEKGKIRSKVGKIVTNKWISFLIIIIIDIMVTVLNDVSMFEPFIVDALGKDISFTGRTVIWAEAILLFLKSPIIGCGFLDSTQFIRLTGNYGGTQPHNLFLAILVYSGIIGILLYAGIFYLAIKNVDKKIEKKINGGYIFRCCVIANFIIGITSMNAYTGFNVASMVILYHYCKIYNLETEI